MPVRTVARMAGEAAAAAGPATDSDVQPVIQAEGVDFAYDGPPVLEGINLTVWAGEFLGIVGPNGGGKTTLLKLILGRLRPRRGAVRLFGRPVAVFRDWQRVGYVPQRGHLLDARFPATVGEVVATGRYGRAGLFRPLGRDDRRAVDRALEAVGLVHLRGRLVGRLSGGEQQRALIARALAGEPELLVLDEPTVGVDAQAQEAFYGLLRHLNRDLGMTLILVSHDVGVVTTEVRQLACVNRRLVYHGPPAGFTAGREALEELYQTPVRLVDHQH